MKDIRLVTRKTLNGDQKKQKMRASQKEHK